MNSFEAISGLVAPRDASVAIWASWGVRSLQVSGCACGRFPRSRQPQPGPLGEAGRADGLELGEGGVQLLPGLDAALAPAAPPRTASPQTREEPGSPQPPSYSPMRQTMSVLAGQSATDRRVMTVTLLLVGSCQIATGAGLTAVRMPARILLILTGLSTLGIAATPEPATGPTSRHLAFAVSCVVTTAVWPVLVARPGADRG
jgi:hypothetical protein